MKKRLLLGHLKVQRFAAVGALGCAVQQLILLKYGSLSAGGAGHLVLHRGVLGFVLVAFQCDLKGHAAVGAVSFACIQIILADVDGLAAGGAGYLVEGLAGDVVISRILILVGCVVILVLGILVLGVYALNKFFSGK